MEKMEKLHNAIIYYKEEFEEIPEYIAIVERFNELLKKNETLEQMNLLFLRYQTFERDWRIAKILPKRKRIAGVMQGFTYLAFVVGLILSFIIQSFAVFFLITVTSALIVKECDYIGGNYSFYRKVKSYAKWFYSAYIWGASALSIIVFIINLKGNATASIFFSTIMVMLFIFLSWIDRDVKHDFSRDEKCL